MHSLEKFCVAIVLALVSCDLATGNGMKLQREREKVSLQAAMGHHADCTYNEDDDHHSWTPFIAFHQDAAQDRGAHSDRGGQLWFGPRLGKRSLKLSSEDNRQAFFKLLEAADTLKYYYDQLPYHDSQADEPEPRVSKKVIFTPKLGRSIAPYEEKIYENVEFTPRLGRRLSDDTPATPADQEIYRPDPEQIDSRTKYFSPRLGRTMNFSPRLGRELSYEMFPEKVRVARSTNKTRST